MKILRFIESYWKRKGFINKTIEVETEDTLKPFSISFFTEKNNIISKNIKIPKICILGLE